MKKSLYMQPAVEVVRTETELMICFSNDENGNILESVGDKVLGEGITSGNLGKDDDIFASDIFDNLW